LVAAALRLYLVLPGNDYSKIWFGRKGKEKSVLVQFKTVPLPKNREKDNAEAQSALRFAEE
jgi:hypothetical protein